jgi:replication initiation and membrane attachment protein DnaB
VIKLRSNRKSAYSPQSMNKIAKIIAENWDETWKIVWQRAQANQTIDHQQLRKLQLAQYNGLTGNHHPSRVEYSLGLR